MAIYLSRRDRAKTGSTCELAALWKRNIRARVRLEFHFYRGF